MQPLKALKQRLHEESALEIEIVDPEMVTMRDGSVEITLIPDADTYGDAPFRVWWQYRGCDGGERPVTGWLMT